MTANADSNRIVAPSRVLALAVIVASMLALMGASQSQVFFLLHPAPEAPPWSQSLAWSAVQWYAWALFVPAAAWLSWRFNFAQGLSVGRLLLHLLFALGFALAHLLLQTTLLFAMPSGRAFLGSFGTGMLTLLATALQWELLSYALVLAGVHSVLYLRRAQAEALARQDLETQAARAQLSALKRQMQPHFLFNALNALVGMQAEDSAEQRFTLRLADLLRLLLDAGERSTATLAEELRVVDAYLQIESVRLGARLALSMDVSAAAEDARLPAFILLPLVENAVTHGIAIDPLGGEVRLYAERNGAHVTIAVINTPRTRGTVSTNRGNGIALDNCRRRLQLMFGAAAGFSAGPTPEHGFEASLTIPADAPAA